MSEIKLLLAIDGGGTKTDFLLTDINGNEIKRIILGPSNPVVTGMNNTEKCLADGINQVCETVDKSTVSVFAGIAGGSIGNNKEIINSYLSSFGFGKVSNGSDTNSALEVSLGGEEGVAVIIGTGIVAFADDGKSRHKIGGWGYLIDKGGSGFHFGSDALESALRHIDGRNGSKIILQMVEEKLKKPLTESIPEIYRQGNSYIASFAPVVFDAYEKGDKEAEKILMKNTKEIAELINTGYGFLNNKKGRVVLCGGLCKKKEFLKKFISYHLKDEIEIEFCGKDIVYGALSLAEKNIGK